MAARLEALARDFMGAVHCRVELLLKADSAVRMDWPQAYWH